MVSNDQVWQGLISVKLRGFDVVGRQGVLDLLKYSNSMELCRARDVGAWN